MSVHLDNKYKKELDFDAINENIHLNLNLISKYPRSSFLKQYIVLKSSQKLPANPEKAIIEFMKIEQLIDMPNEHMLNLTKLGYEVQRKGGWQKHLNREKVKAVRDNRKAIYDFINSKWKYWTFWPVIILGAIGGIYSSYDFFTEKLNPKSDPKIQKIESELNDLKEKIMFKNDSIKTNEIK